MQKSCTQLWGAHDEGKHEAVGQRLACQSLKRKGLSRVLTNGDFLGIIGFIGTGTLEIQYRGTPILITLNAVDPLGDKDWGIGGEHREAVRPWMGSAGQTGREISN